ncbi:MAG: hypothetical protein KDE58_31315 [Caldilineaceae bacterium]|nr:hypothetical protein [Caldilineaceae bacterium]
MTWDRGYPRAVNLESGEMMVVYYFNCADDAVQCNGGVYHIAGTVFTP